MRFSGFFGVVLAFGILIADIFLADNVFNFIYLPALMVCVFGTIGLGYLSFGALDTLRAMRSIALLVASPPAGEDPTLRRSERVLKGAIVHLYACGTVGTMISFLKMISYMATKQTFIWGISPTMISLLPLFYAVVGAEFLLRPAANRIEGILGNHSE